MSWEHLNVLVVDDSPFMTQILRTMLSGFGVRRIREVRTVEEAMKACQQEAPDLAIVDFQLGEDSGLEFCRTMRGEDSPSPYLPIILCTAHSERSRALAAINAGVNEFLVKPVTAQGVYSRVRAVVETPRPFVRAPGYFGPDRRRRQDPDYKGPLRRIDDQGAAEID